MLRSGMLLTAGNLGGALLQLLRNVLIARLVSVEDYGIAATFAIAMAALEMVSAFALDRLIVQAREGEDARFQEVLQALQLIRGAVMAALMLALAHPIAALFGVPEIAWAYQLLAVVPLVRGAVHFDIFRAERDMRFAPRVRAEVLPLLVSTLVAGGLGLWLGDWRAMLWALVVQHSLYAAWSWREAGRAYRLAWDGPTAARAMRFGWPLLVNGGLMFLIFQGDRIIVGNRLGLEVLGWFGAAFTLTLMASTVLARTLQSLTLPKLSPLAGDRGRFVPASHAVVEAGLLVGALIAVGTAVLGPALFLLLFGPKYAPALPLVVWLGLMQGIRVAKAGPANVALAAGETTNPMIANFVRCLGLPAVWFVLDAGAGLLAAVWVATLFESLALGVAFWLLRANLDVPLAGLGRPLAATAFLFVLVGMLAAMRPAGGESVAEQLNWVQAALVPVFGVYVLLGLPALRTRGPVWSRRRVG